MKKTIKYYLSLFIAMVVTLSTGCTNTNSNVSNNDYEENKELCDEIEQIAINFRYAEFCYELAANFDWVNKKLMEEIVLEDGNPEINYFYAINVDGADIERHKKVILDNEYSDDDILERVKKL